MSNKIKRAWLKYDVYCQICDDFNRWYPKETGGLLVGYWSEDFSEFVITDFVGPGPKAYHGRYLFSPDYDYQQKALDGLLNFGKNPLFYLGDWHSHPRGKLKLSLLDKYALFRISKNKSAYVSQPIMLIINDSDDGAYRVWVRQECTARTQGSCAIVELRCSVYDS